MVKIVMWGFVPYSAVLLALVFSPDVSQAVNPVVTVLVESMWWTYAFIAAAMMFYAYDLPIGFMEPSKRLRAMFHFRLLDLTRRL